MRLCADHVCLRLRESPAIRDTLCQSDRQCGVSKSDGPELSRRLQSVKQSRDVRESVNSSAFKFLR